MVVLIGRYGCAIWGMVVLFGGCGRVILRYGCVINPRRANAERVTVVVSCVCVCVCVCVCMSVRTRYSGSTRS